MRRRQDPAARREGRHRRRQPWAPAEEVEHRPPRIVTVLREPGVDRPSSPISPGECWVGRHRHRCGGSTKRRLAAGGAAAAVLPPPPPRMLPWPPGHPRTLLRLHSELLPRPNLMSTDPQRERRRDSCVASELPRDHRRNSCAASVIWQGPFRGWRGIVTAEAERVPHRRRRIRIPRTDFEIESMKLPG